MFEKILYPTDFSEASKRALEYVKGLKEAGVKEVVLLYVVDRREVEVLKRYDYLTFFSDKDPMELMRGKAEEGAKALVKEVEQEGLKVKIRIEEGIPFEEILKVEEEENVSLVVLGSHGRSSIERMLLGSVSEKVVRKSKKPVLVVR